MRVKAGKRGKPGEYAGFVFATWGASDIIGGVLGMISFEAGDSCQRRSPFLAASQAEFHVVQRTFPLLFAAVLVASCCSCYAQNPIEPTVPKVVPVVVAPEVEKPVLATDQFLPSTTKGYLSIPDVDQFVARSSGTQLGQMTDDPTLKEFAEDLSRQMKLKLGHTQARIGLTLDDLQGINSGEAAIASIEPGPGKHAMVLLADVAGNEKEAAILLYKMSKNVVGKGGKKALLRIEKRSVTQLDIPARGPKLKGRSVYHLLAGNWLIASDSPTEIASVLQRIDSGGDAKSLANLPAYAKTMHKAKATIKGDDWQLRFFVEPFGYMNIVKALSEKRDRKGKADLTKVLHNQGFTAVKGVGGYVTLDDGDHDFIHRTFVYVPQGGQALTKAARMLDFPNTETLAPQDWVPQKLSNYASFNWKLQKAFEHSKSLVNELAGDETEDIFDDVLESIRTDPDGPQIDIRKEIVANLGERLTVISHYKEPITADSERILLAVELASEEDVRKAAARIENVRKAVARIMDFDDNAELHMINDTPVWEIKPPEGDDVADPEIDPGFQDPFALEPEPKAEEKSLPSSAVSIAHGHLIIGTHMDIVVDIVKNEGPSLAESADFIRMEKTLTALGAGPQSMRTFGRVDEAYRVNYELLRKGAMPESETMLGGLMNKLLGGEGIREAEVDGDKMPPFDEVRKYLGTSGSFSKAEEDGLLFVGCMLKKPSGADSTKDGPPPVPEEPAVLPGDPPAIPDGVAPLPEDAVPLPEGSAPLPE